jgi:hypothetical protein
LLPRAAGGTAADRIAALNRFSVFTSAESSHVPEGGGSGYGFVAPSPSVVGATLGAATSITITGADLSVSDVAHGIPSTTSLRAYIAEKTVGCKKKFQLRVCGVPRVVPMS